MKDIVILVVAVVQVRGSDTNGGGTGSREGQGHNGGSGVVLLAYPT